MQSESGDAEARTYSRSLAKALFEQADAHEIHLLLNAGANTDVEPFFAEFNALFPTGRIHIFTEPSGGGADAVAARWRARAAALIRDNLIGGIAPDLVHVLPVFTGDDAARKTWASVSDAINALEQTGREREACVVSARFKRRPTMAFVSPLPGDRTGIATYSAELLPELARHYDIECIVHETLVTDAWILKHSRCRDTNWFERNALNYDRILYCVGNSPFHAHMFPLMLRFPGVVILHDIFLGNLVEWMARTRPPGDEFDLELYRSHGLEGLSLKARDGIGAVIERFQLNGGVFRNALGVIVHSAHAADLVKAAYGVIAEESLAAGQSLRAEEILEIVPHLRAPLKTASREDARARLDIAPDDFVVVSFGLVTRHKLGRLLCEAWRLAGLQDDASCRLVFVGEIDDDYGENLRDAAASVSANIVFTDHASSGLYAAYGAAADAAVQLREHSRGETSGALLDGMAAGLPVICNAHGSFREIPEDCVLMLDESPRVDDLAEKLSWLFHNRGRSRLIGDRARAYVMRVHDPNMIGIQIKDAVERFYGDSPLARQRQLLAAIAGLAADAPLTLEDRRDIARCVAANERYFGDRQDENGPPVDQRHAQGCRQPAPTGSVTNKIWARVVAIVSTWLTVDMRRVAKRFDKSWYLERNPDVAAAGIDPLLHFMSHGHQEGRWPNSEFDPAWYLTHNPDVARSGMNPFVHFTKFGNDEGRSGRAPGRPPNLGYSRADDVMLRLDLAIEHGARRAPRDGNSDERKRKAP